MIKYLDFESFPSILKILFSAYPSLDLDEIEFEIFQF